MRTARTDACVACARGNDARARTNLSEKPGDAKLSALAAVSISRKIWNQA